MFCRLSTSGQKFQRHYSACCLTLQAAISAKDIRFCRIDGNLVSAEARQEQVRRFQSRPDIPVFLLTSQVGGLGLTLTAADRVIIVDPSWNPAVDNQVGRTISMVG